MAAFHKFAVWSSKCPACSSDNVRHSHRRNAFEQVISTVLRPHLCEECGQRWFRMPQKSTAAQKTPGDEDGRG